jgi:hypothetical protein
MAVLLTLCLVAGLLPSLLIDTISPVAKDFVGGRMPTQAELSWLSIAPVAESRSSYNGLLVFIFILFSAYSARWVIHRFGTTRSRRAPAWDCGYIETSTTTQYTGSSFAQPIRRTLGVIAFSVRDRLDMPAPGDTRAARLSVEIKDRIFDYLYAPLTRAVESCATGLNILSLLTIQEYLALVFAALVFLLVLVAI